MADPFPRVAGGGLAQLRAAGIEVHVGVLEAEARALKAPYLKLLATGTPWVVAKWAMTLDGKIATRTGESKWISNDAARTRVHDLRGRVDAVVVGRGTVLADDPLLTARPPGQRTAARVVVTASGDLPGACQLTATARETPVIVYTANPGKLAAWADAGAEVVGLPDVTPAAVLADLGRRRFTNVLVEGGAGLLGGFRDAGAIDEVWAFVAPKLFGGAAAPGPVAGAGVGPIADARPALTTAVEVLGDKVLVTCVFTRPAG
jgi:diaminohydroxyphosphoribosylaminopyrimidine deaminase/5-amino-6-(5-phosphoribosylamino)uracil reductase